MLDFTVYTEYTVKQKGVFMLATKAVNMKWDEPELSDMKKVAAVFHMTLTDFVKDACREHVRKLKADPLFRLTVNVEKASDAESAEILSDIASLSDDDLQISSAKRFSV